MRCSPCCARRGTAAASRGADSQRSARRRARRRRCRSCSTTLVRAGEVVVNRRGAVLPARAAAGLVVGTVSAHRDGDGFAAAGRRLARRCFSPPQQMREVMHGDRVAVRVEGSGLSRPAAGRDRRGARAPHARGRRPAARRGRHRVSSCRTTRASTHRVLVPRGALGGARVRPGRLVELTEQPSRNAQPRGPA